MYALFSAGVALWGVYGLLTGDGPLIAANAITLVAAGLILDRKWRAFWRERQVRRAAERSDAQRLRGGRPLP